MQKLSKEQAEWLIEHIRSKYNVYCTKCTINCNVDTDKYLEKVINQCTEKQFPELKVGEGPLVYVTNIYKLKKTSIDTFGITAHLTTDEFKQFVEGCNKIVEYLNETY